MTQSARLSHFTGEKGSVVYSQEEYILNQVQRCVMVTKQWMMTCDIRVTHPRKAEQIKLKQGKPQARHILISCFSFMCS